MNKKILSVSILAVFMLASISATSAVTIYVKESTIKEQDSMEKTISEEEKTNMDNGTLYVVVYYIEKVIGTTGFGYPLEDATVIVKPCFSGPKYTGKTDAMGECTFELYPGYYKVTAEKEGYYYKPPIGRKYQYPTILPGELSELGFYLVDDNTIYPINTIHQNAQNAVPSAQLELELMNQQNSQSSRNNPQPAPVDRPVTLNTFLMRRVFNSQQLVQVEVSKWTEDNELVTSIEIWPRYKVDEFLEAMDSAGEITGQHFAVMQQYGLIPQGKTQEDLENFLADQCDQLQQTIEDFEQHIDLATSKGGDYCGFNAVISGSIHAPFFCLRIPILAYIIHSDYGGEITIELPDLTIPLSGNQLFNMVIYILLGIFFPPLHNGENYINTAFGGTAGYLSVEVE